jgi:hypothetical protein
MMFFTQRSGIFFTANRLGEFFRTSAELTPGGLWGGKSAPNMVAPELG